MADLNDMLDKMEQLEVDARRRKALEHSFKEYMESPKGKKISERNKAIKFELLGKEKKKYKAPIFPNPDKDESLIGTKF